MVRKEVSESEISEPNSENIEQLKQEEQILREQLRTLPYQLILKQKQNISVTDSGPVNKQKRKLIKKPQKTAEREQKDAPSQMNIHQRSKRKAVKIFEPFRKKTIDPRFESYTGNYNPDQAKKAYAFIPQLQKQQIDVLKQRLKSKSKRKRLTAHERQVLTRNYNVLTSDQKRMQLADLKKQTKKTLEHNAGPNYYPKEKVINEQFQKKKLSELPMATQSKVIRQKQQRTQKVHQVDKIKILRNN